MSVTFAITNAPIVAERSECLCVDDGVAFGRCSYCHGTGVDIFERPADGYSMNLNNGNARALLGAIGIDSDELHGSLEGDELDRVIARALRAVNLASVRAPYLRGGFDAGSEERVVLVAEGNVVHIERHGGARIHECGLDDEGLTDRLGGFLALVRLARSEGRSVRWS